MISEDLDLAIKILESEGIIGFPTETVYGLAGNVFSRKAINDIFHTKQRPSNNPLIVHIKSIEDMDNIAMEIPAVASKLASVFWPGPLTLILKKKPSVPDIVTGGKSTVAVRMPNHPLALSLLNKLSFPLAAPSANPFGMVSPTKAKHVQAYFEDKISMILDGGSCKIGIESTIIGFEKNQVVVYRLGSIGIDEIESIAGNVKIYNQNDTAPEAPGMFTRHYSPNTPLILTDNMERYIHQFSDKKIGLLRFSEPLSKAPFHCIQKILSPDCNLAEAGTRLYDTLHQLDQLNLDVLIAERFPNIGFGIVINDKLSRAAATS